MTSSATPETRVRVWDLPVRIFHWSLTVLVAGALLTGEEDDWSTAHARLGLLILGLVVFRVVWGFIGSAPARFATFVRSPREVLAYAREYVRGRPPLHLSHNPLGASMVVLLLLVLLATIGTGIAMRLGPEWDGPLTPYLTRGLVKGLEEAHEVAAGALPILVLFHIAGVVLSSVLERQNLIAGMITGYKRGLEALPAPVRHPAVRFAAALLLSTSAVFGLESLLHAQPAEAATTPAALVQAYAGEARASDPAFPGFDAKRGEQLYRTPHTQAGKSVACTDCHTADPKARGQTPAGKRIEPLAPSANPEAFTDRARADKWFDRNCKQVLGRTCTAHEKGDLITWLTGL